MTNKVIIVGAGPAGLATAATLRAAGIPSTILEKSDAVASSWRGHYDRLHLHTHRNRSGLPGMKMPGDYPKYPTRAQVVDYFDTYAAQNGISPEFGITVTDITHDSGWQIKAADGRAWHADEVVIATGQVSHPKRADWPGLSGFTGTVLHSNEYRNPTPFAGQRVLVVGFGNSGGEIAMDLADAGVTTHMAVRGAVNVVPRELFGIPITSMSMVQQLTSPRFADALTAPILRLVVGDITKLGLRRANKGPSTQVVEDQKVPLIDIGALDRLRSGKLMARPGVTHIDGSTVAFADGTSDAFDVILMATGYRPDLRALLPGAADLLDSGGTPKSSGATSGRDGLYFCSFRVSPRGQIFEMSQEAEAIATAISARRAQARAS
ncbi:MAG: flavin-containing monooxygenase [Pseudooceanicola sp.]